MSIFTFDAEGDLVLNNGIAYGAIAGGATGYIEEHYKWYIGDHRSAYLAMLVSRGVDDWRIVAMLSIRGAITEAARIHADELGALVVGNALQLNAAEQLDNPAVEALTVRARLTTAEWVAAGNAANADAAIVRVPPAVQARLRTPENIQWANMCARMAYTVIAVNGLGLITAAHHFRAAAEQAANNTLKMYEIDRFVRNIGATVKDAAGFIFHDCLHPLSYEAVAELTNTPTAGFSGKVASTVLKRIPAFPGGVTFVQRAMSCRKAVQGSAQYAAIAPTLAAGTADVALRNLNTDIIATPLNYNGQFRPAQYAGHKAAIDAVVPYCVVLFALYDCIFPPRAGAENAGPTGGPGIRKLIDENPSIYSNTLAEARAVIAEARLEATATYFGRVATL